MQKESADSDSIPDNESSTPVKQRKVAKEVDSADSNETSTNTTNWLSEDEAQKLRIALREKQKASMVNNIHVQIICQRVLFA